MDIKVGVSDNETPVTGVLVNLSVNGNIYNAASNDYGIANFDLGTLSADLYAITAQAGGCKTSEEVYLPIYDPNGGFVTGGGWIYSEPGNMPANPHVEGKANFGFNAKYKAGKNNSTEVDGNTNFQFNNAGFHFKSSSHEEMSLIISGDKKATYRGVGTVNGQGSHYFIVTVIDGDASGGDGTDYFRIVVYSDGTSSPAGQPIYDNESEAALNADASTAIGGGSIVIHKPKGKNSKQQEEEAEKSAKVPVEEPKELIVENLDILEKLVVAPNPVQQQATIRFSLLEAAGVQLRLFDSNGRELKRLYSGNVAANQVVDVTFIPENLPSGIYICKLSTDRGHSYNTRIIID